MYIYSHNHQKEARKWVVFIHVLLTVVSKVSVTRSDRAQVPSQLDSKMDAIVETSIQDTSVRSRRALDKRLATIALDHQIAG